MAQASDAPAPTASMAGHPGWYGSVMGTGVLALAVYLVGAAWDWTWAEWLGAALLIMASVLAVLLLPRYVRRLRERHALTAEIADAGRGPLLATLPAGLLVLAGAWGSIGPMMVPADVAHGIDAVLLTIGAVLGIALSLAWASSAVRGAHGLESVNGAWLIPPVMNLLVPVGLGPLIAANPGVARELLVVALVFTGIGTLLFLGLMPLLVARLVLQQPAAPMMAPTLWVPLAPAGLLGLAILKPLQGAVMAGVAGEQVLVVGVAATAASVGFGLWWAAFAALETLQARRRGPIMATPGWWAFVFPPGALVVAICTMATVLGSTGPRIVALIATLALAVVWVRVSVVTFRQR